MTHTPLQLERAYNKIRDELREVGLLVDGRYLDEIDCATHYAPSALVGGEYGRVYDEGAPWFARLGGFRDGTIYVSGFAPTRPYARGESLVDVIRHEFAHAWAWRDRPLFRRRWFREAFGAPYDAPKWATPDEFDAAHYVSEYATERAKEDFAETFMVFLRDRRSLARYRRREGVHAKLMAVGEAVEEAAGSRVWKARLST
jgi:hypothetical protein